MADYQEHEHDMIGEGETPEDLLETGDEQAEELARAAEAKKRKDKKFKVMVFGVAGVALLGIGGVKILGSSPAPAPVGGMAALNQPSFPQPTPVAAAPTPVAPVAPMAAPVAPVAPVAPMASAMPSPGVPASGLGMPNAMDPGFSPTAPVAPVGQFNAGLPVAQFDAPKPAPEGFARGLDELGKKIDDLKSMFTKFDEMNIGDRLAKLEARVSALEGGKPSSKPAASANIRRHAQAPRVAAPRVVPLGEGEDLLFTRISGARPAAEPVARASRAQPAQEVVARNYALQAVIPGRIWIKGNDGNSQTFEAGDTLPDGSKVLKIDPDRGETTTSKGVLRFEMK